MSDVPNDNTATPRVPGESGRVREESGRSSELAARIEEFIFGGAVWADCPAAAAADSGDGVGAGADVGEVVLSEADLELLILAVMRSHAR